MKVSLENNADFVGYIKSICDKNKLQVDDVKRSLGGLYHNLSKSYRGVDGEVSIFEEDWSATERAAFIILFKYCNVPFVLYDREKCIVEPNL